MPIVQATAPDWASNPPPTAAAPDNSGSVPVQATVPDWAQSQDTSSTTPTDDPETDRILDGFRHVESADGTQLVGPPVKTKYGIERALGPYQFLPSTAADVGLSNPFDEKAAREATKDYYLKHKEEFGSEDLAIAAHDAGPGTIRSLIKTYGPDKAFDHLKPDVKQYVASVKGYEPQTQAVQPVVPDWAQQQPTQDQGTPVQATVPAWAQPSQSDGGLSDYIKTHGLVDTTGTMGDRAKALWNEAKNEFIDPAKVLMGAGASMLGGIGSMAPLQQEAGPAEFATMGQQVPQSDFPEQTLAQTNQNMGALGQTLHDTMWSQFSPDTQKLMDKGAEGMDILGKIYNAPVNGASYVARKAGLNQTADFIDTYGMAAWQALMPLALEKAGSWGAKAYRKVVGERTVNPDLAGKATPGKGGIVTDDDIEAAKNSPQPEQPADPNVQSKSPTAPVKSDVQPGPVQAALNLEQPAKTGQGEFPFVNRMPEGQSELPVTEENQPFMKGPTVGDQQELPLQRPPEPGQGTLDLNPPEQAPTQGELFFDQFATKPSGNLKITPRGSSNTLFDISRRTPPEPGASPPVVMAGETSKAGAVADRTADTGTTSVKQAPRPLKGGKQAGSAPILDDAARAILDGLDKGLTLLSRSNFKVGDWVKTMNDTLAKITEVKNENGTPVYTVREDGGKTYDLPRGGINYKYRPSGQVVNPVGYEKTPSPLFDNVTAKPVVLPKNQRGSVSMEWANKLADNIREMMNPDVKEEPEKPSIGPPLSAEAVKGKVDLAYSLSRPHDFNDFQTHMEDAVQQAPGMDAHILDPEKLKALWDGYENGTITISPNEYVGMSETARREGNAASPYAVMRQSIPKELRSEQDIGRVREDLLGSLFSGYLTFDKPAVQLLKWAGDTGRHIYEVANRLNTKLMAYAKPFYALSRAGMREVSQAFADWDFQGKYHKELLDSGLQYPSIEMLKAKGMSDKGAAAYDSVAKGYQAAFKFVRDSKGNIIKQLPGYMPHMWKGFWSFKVMTDDLKGTYAIEKADSKGELTRLQQKYIEQGFKTTRIEDPSHFSSYDMVMGLQDSIMNMMDDSKVTGLTRKLIQGRIDRVMEGTLYESLERHGVHGFIGEHGPLEEDWRNPFRAIKARRSNNEIFGLYKKYVGDVTRAWRNEQMVRSVLQPMSQDLSLGPLTNLRKAVVDTVAKGTGFSSRELNFADKAVRDVLIKAGVNPELPTTLTLALNEYARKMTINSANIGFAAQHGLFHLFAVSNLLKVHTDLVNKGEAHGNLAASLGKYFASQIPGTWRLSDAAAQAARDRFATDGLETHMYGYDTAAGKVSDLVWHGLLNLFVNYSRRVTFDTHYSYFREFMPEEQAYQASKMSTNRVMQSFNPIDRPSIFNEGNLARAAMPFQQIKSYSFGRVFGSLETVADSIKSKKPANIMRALSVPISLYATYMLTSGLTGGTPLANDWNTVSKLLNDKFDTKLPTYENWLIQSHTPFGAVIGPLSYLLGRDVSSTFESPSVTAPLGGFAGLERGVDLAELLFFEIAKFGFGYQNTLAEKKIFESNMPTQLRRVYDYFYAQQTSGELQDAHGRSMYKQTLAQMLGDAITGKLSYGEAETRAKISASRAKDAEDQNYVERQSQNLYDILMNKNPSIILPSGNPDFVTKLKEVSSAGRGFNPDSFIQYVQNKMAKEKQPYVRQYLTNIMNSKDIYQRQRMINNFKNVFGSQ